MTTIPSPSVGEKVGVIIGHSSRKDYSAYVDTVAQVSPSGQVKLQSSGVRFTPKGWGIGKDDPYYRLTTVVEAEKVIEEVSQKQAQREQELAEKERREAEAEKDWLLKSPQIQAIASESAEVLETTVLRLATEMGVNLVPGSLDVLNHQVENLLRDYLKGLKHD